MNHLFHHQNLSTPAASSPTAQTQAVRQETRMCSASLMAQSCREKNPAAVCCHQEIHIYSVCAYMHEKMVYIF